MVTINQGKSFKVDLTVDSKVKKPAFIYIGFTQTYPRTRWLKEMDNLVEVMLTEGTKTFDLYPKSVIPLDLENGSKISIRVIIGDYDVENNRFKEIYDEKEFKDIITVGVSYKKDIEVVKAYIITV